MRKTTILVAAACAALVTGTLSSPALAVPKPAGQQPNAVQAPATFTHPGVGVSRPQLDFVRAKVQAGAQPWTNAFNQARDSKYGSLSRTPTPRAVVECGPYSNPNLGCTNEREDAIAAYTDAVLWYVTRDDRYAQKAIQLMDAWSATIRDHTNSNAPLQTAWAASSWPKAAEIIKHAYGNWPNAGRFGTMLRNVYLPEIYNGSNSNGNWELSMTEAIQGIGVFLDDKAVYDQAISLFRVRTPAFVYLESDGALPKTKPSQNLNTRDKIIAYWHGQTTFVNGLTQETCRDFTHTGYGISAISHVLETSRIQGIDLYGEFGERLRHALGFQSRWERNLEPVPSWLCNGSIHRGLGPITEVGYNALHTRLGIAMTNTQALTESRRPAGSNNLFVAFETLTHAENPS
ncbi:alginate lyase [Kribbella sp. VKM Ac-2527]|uniref:Alginate lyase n=1 Tax=Kribbella caucasensis TaxID=2512215 RepID=A0A4R6KP94_9ACTN|nr:alginate lyase family protein [Kribbella sp. VKM Ac-2527]TDO54452.1 alginate lyase [Kribbella sp. VKM Ac-2527]